MSDSVFLLLSCGIAPIVNFGADDELILAVLPRLKMILDILKSVDAIAVRNSLPALERWILLAHRSHLLRFHAHQVVADLITEDSSVHDVRGVAELAGEIVGPFRLRVEFSALFATPVVAGAVAASTAKCVFVDQLLFALLASRIPEHATGLDHKQVANNFEILSFLLVAGHEIAIRVKSRLHLAKGRKWQQITADR